ncbi:hypothetical protein MF406_10525 [Georgenia sp. TF02-10]|uniref:hypothetical protein n=1 Tax=Georgenia sp. TF02-10 TaxID=2917725 RepID=UPI001FA7C738|nr:hypothetical protein [Georgenia sp. TF02-10]UNX53438.1 hypothetical protein MF406_10525 [Georgenia sp. TF02-10]
MNDYSVDWPLWDGRGGPMEPDDLPLSEGLRADLRAWAERFNADFDYERGWPDSSQLERHRRDAEELLCRLRVEVPTQEFTLQLWEESTAQD